MSQGFASIDDTARAKAFDGGVHRIPFVAYTREDLYARELARIFYRGHW